MKKMGKVPQQLLEPRISSINKSSVVKEWGILLCIINES